jgi:hypothetical protein
MTTTVEIDDVSIELIDNVNLCIKTAELEFSKLSKDVLDLDGVSGRKSRLFYNNLLQLFSSRLLHLGNGDKSIIASALYNNNSKVFLIDNYNNNQQEIDNLNSIVEKYRGNNYFRFLNDDFRNIESKKLFKFNIFSFHASIDYDIVRSALSKFIDNMNDTFVVIYNDINWGFIRDAVSKSISDLNLTILFEKEIKLTYNDSHTPMDQARETWWNGQYIAVVRKNV